MKQKEKYMNINLQTHYRDFQSIIDPTNTLQIKYLNDNIDDLSTYDINVPNLIKAWESNQWPWNRPKIEGDFLG
tara:strand:+ start:736 stop:957 length:222 start_codon:yes stop_codon:yes gene_type:complete